MRGENSVWGAGAASAAQSVLGNLESRLAAKTTEDTDVMEFLAITGLQYRTWRPLFEAARQYEVVEHFYDSLQTVRKQRFSKLSPSQKMVESSLCRGLYNEYASGHALTLGDLCEEKNPRILRTPQIGPKSIAMLSELMGQYGLTLVKSYK